MSNIETLLKEVKKQENMFFNQDAIINSLKTFSKDSIHIVADFDRTITSGIACPTWNLLSCSNVFPEEYNYRVCELNDNYRPIEINYSLTKEYREEKMTEWWDKSLELLIEYGVNQEMIAEIIANDKLLLLREGAMEFLKLCNSDNIPVIIISAGIGNIIVEFLKHSQLLTENVHVISNFLSFEDGVANGVKADIIHCLNKNESELHIEIKEKIKDRPNAILLGDSIDDINMVSNERRNKTLAIGFLEDNIESNLDIYRNTFDIVYANNGSFEDITNLINNLK